MLFSFARLLMKVALATANASHTSTPTVSAVVLALQSLFHTANGLLCHLRLSCNHNSKCHNINDFIIISDSGAFRAAKAEEFLQRRNKDRRQKR